MAKDFRKILEKGLFAHKAGRIGEAEKFYKSVLKNFPKQPGANFNLGILKLETGNVGAALPYLKTALEADPGTAQHWLAYIDALTRFGEIDDAKSVLQQAKARGAKGPVIDQLSQSIAKLEMSRPPEPKADVIRGLTNKLQNGEAEAVLQELNKLAREFPSSPSVFNLKAAVKLKLGEFSAAREDIDRSLALKPNSAETHLISGRIFQSE